MDRVTKSSTQLSQKRLSIQKSSQKNNRSTSSRSSYKEKQCVTFDDKEEKSSRNSQPHSTIKFNIKRSFEH